MTAPEVRKHILDRLFQLPGKDQQVVVSLLVWNMVYEHCHDWRRADGGMMIKGIDVIIDHKLEGLAFPVQVTEEALLRNQQLLMNTWEVR